MPNTRRAVTSERLRRQRAAVGHTAESWWKIFAARPWLSGGFVWTGFDYRGEPTPYSWPCINSHFGIMDTCGFAKDNFYYYQSWWSDRTVLHLLPHWNWPGKEGQDIDVRCFAIARKSSCSSTAKASAANPCPPIPISMDCQIRARRPAGQRLQGRPGHRRTESRNHRRAAAVKLTPDRATIDANGEDLSIITVSVTDAAGRIVPVADNHIDFELSGPGRIIGVGNGDPSCHEPDVYIATQPSQSVALKDWRIKRGARYPRPEESAEKVDDQTDGQRQT
jgi:beta-galactosidase